MRSTRKLVREGDFVAEVSVRLLDDAGAWSPVLSREDATKLDDVRHALQSGNVRRASQLADHVYRSTLLAS